MNKLKLLFFTLLFFFTSTFFNNAAYAQVQVVNPNQIYTYHILASDITKLKQKYPDLINVQIIGKSEYGRNLYAISLGKGQASLFINGAHHAREWLTTNLNMYMIEKYAEAYTKNQSIDGFNARNILNSTTIWFVPMVNPDGITLQQQGLKAFPKSTHKTLIKMNEGSKNFKRWKANGKGIDLNRQYNAGWKAIKSPKSPKYKDFKGYSPESAAETKAVLKFVQSINPEMSVSYHSSGKILFWNYKQSKSEYYRDLGYAKTIGKMTGYRLIHPGKNPSGGGFTDWFIEAKKRPAFTPEISKSVYETSPPLSEFGGAWKENKAVGLYTANESFKLFDLRMKQSTDNLVSKLSKLQSKSKGLRKYYSHNIKTDKDLKIDSSFLYLYNSVNKEVLSLEQQSAKLTPKHKARLASYFKGIYTSRNEAKMYIDGVNAGEKLLRANKRYETLFAEGKFDNITFASHSSLSAANIKTQILINKMYGPHVRSLAAKKYLIPSKNLIENTKLEMERYTLLKTIESRLESGETTPIQMELETLARLEYRSTSLKQTNPAVYKTYPAAEQNLLSLKTSIMEALKEKDLIK